MVALSHKHSSPSADDSAVSTWPAGARPAPAFTLTDDHGKSFSLASLHGRSAIVAFIDRSAATSARARPACLTEAAAARREGTRDRLGQRRPLGRHRHELQGRRHPLEARPDLALGDRPYAELARVWKPYDVGVEVTNKTIAGVKVRYITHTGAAI